MEHISFKPTVGQPEDDLQFDPGQDTVFYESRLDVQFPPITTPSIKKNQVIPIDERVF